MELRRSSLTLADPSRFLTRLARVLRPFHFLVYLIWPAVILAAITSYYNWYDLMRNLDRNLATFTFLQHLVLSMVTDNLLKVTMVGVAMAANGVPPTKCGIRLMFGVMPRFFVGTSPIKKLDFPEQRQCYGASILTRLALFSVGILTWAVLYRSGSGFADAALVLGNVGFVALLFCINPLWMEAGYHWMAAWFEMPKLREDSYRLLGLMLRFKPIPEHLPPRTMAGLIAYAVGSIAFTTLQIGTLTVAAAWGLEQQYSGTGVIMFSVIMSSMLLFLFSLGTRRPSRRKEKAVVKDDETRVDIPNSPLPTDTRGTYDFQLSGNSPMARNKSQRAAPAGQRQEDADDGTSIDLDMFLSGDVKETATARWPAAVNTDLDEILSPAAKAPAEAPAAESSKPPPSASHKLDKVLKIGTARPTRASKIRKYVILAALLGGLVYVAFLPYPYTVGGDFVVQPVARHQVRARTSGEIIKLNIEAGQWLKQDDIIAVLANWDEDRDVGLALADLARLKADLQTLIAGPKPEEIRLAEQLLKGTETKLTEAKQQLDRKKQLYETKVASLKDLEDAQNNYDLALSERGQAQAKLDLLKSPVLPSEVDAAQAKITHKQEEVDYNKLQLEHTYVRAPISGQIITTLDNITVGSYVREGDIITEIADQRTVEVSIDVPETDVNESVIGASVTLKLWSAPNESITGTVKSISPIAEQRDYGRIVSITVVVPNPKGTLTRNMTGYGKINVGDRPVWEVFTKAIVRFVQIEMWSWLP